MAKTALGYRAEVVGSLLRPEYLKEAFDRFDRDEIGRTSWSRRRIARRSRRSRSRRPAASTSSRTARCAGSSGSTR